MNKPLLVLLFTIVFVLLDWYAFQVFKTAVSSYSITFQKISKSVFLGVAVLALLSFFYYHLGNPDSLGKHARTFIMSFIFMNYLAKFILVIFALLDDIQRAARWIFFKLANPEVLKKGEGISRSEFLAKTGVIVAVAPIISLSWGIISGAHDYRIRKLDIPIKGLPKALDGLRIGQLSDIHAGSFWNKTAVKGGVEMLMKEKADLFLFTGDLVNNRATEMSEWGEIFGKLKAPLGMYSVFGNHDYGDYVEWDSVQQKSQNLKDLAKIHKGMGWELLMNEHKVISIDGEKLGLIGVENWSAKGRFPKHGNLAKAVAEMPDTSATVLLSHDPSHWRAEVLNQSKKIDLTLSGHTHGMQFGIEIPGFKWSPVQYVYDEWAGLYESAKQFLYVNRGFGYIGYPGRFGILPEISILTLKAS